MASVLHHLGQRHHDDSPHPPPRHVE
jgi:hypothetical protein